ncbi:MAG: penicillin-binding protein 2 [Holosporales bacterium]|jgi:cell division protein FtsI (penicillin-binding protein 3)|nr:penicillin-binding protein 2 [Holosporales bacterium]
MELLRGRLIFFGICSILAFCCISYRIADIMFLGRDQKVSKKSYKEWKTIKKADILDRNGELLATSLATASCYAIPSAVIDIDNTADRLSKVLKFKSSEEIKKKLIDKNKHFVWILRHISPKLQEKILDIGLPGIKFQKDYKRVYIYGNLFSHVLGHTDIDGIGLSGLEKYFDELATKSKSLKKLVSSLDVRLQLILNEELNCAISKFNAEGGNAILMSVDGKILAMVSLPDFDPNNIKGSSLKWMFNKNTLGVFEQGSVLKILNVAIALDSGYAKVNSVFDASNPIRIGKFLIKDFKGKNRDLTLAEAFVFSSNIASARIAQSFGANVQKAYMKKFGMLDRTELEIFETAYPILPKHWGDTACMSISYGYGLAVTPLQLLAAVTSIVNGGIKIGPTLIRDKGPNTSERIRVVSEKTSAIVRDLMRAVVCFGTGKNASIDGVEIFGKTGTSYKISGKGYGADGNRKRIATFLGGFPKDNPKYMILISLDDPKPISETFGYAAAGWNAAPTAKNILNRITPILCDGYAPSADEERLMVAKFITK